LAHTKTKEVHVSPKNLNLLVGAAAFTLAMAAPLVSGQTFPAKPVRIVVGFASGGNVDIPTRIVASKLGELWGTSVIVDNRPGAGGNIGADLVAKAAPDGYTLLTCNAASHGINPSFYKKIPFDAVKDFAFISQIGLTANVLLVHPSVPAKTVSEFIAYAKANPGKISFASAGVGTSQHLAMELLKSMTGINVVHVPYKGGHPALTDLLGGQVQAMFAAVPTSQASIKAGKVRALGVTSPKRSPNLPDVPTIAESGVPGFSVTSWYGLCAPAAVPKPILAKLHDDLVKVLAMPDTQQRLSEQGIDVTPSSPEDFAEFVKTEVAKWAKVVKEAGISAD
jgi:tripartite-type tricarboxylate transporter receptor subunit TctC